MIITISELNVVYKDDTISKILSNNSIIKRRDVFNRNFIPLTLQARRNQLQRLANDFKIIIDKSTSCAVHVLITGKLGVGKTVIAKYFCQRLSKEAEKRGVKILYRYYNCFAYRRIGSVLREIMKYFGVPTRGFSDDENLETLNTRLRRENKHLILILDEADIFGAEPILHIIHAADSVGFGDARISTILISRQSKIQELMSTEISERLSDKIVLDGYTKEELKGILQVRAGTGLHPNRVVERAIDKVSEIAAITGNARHAIDILFHAGNIAERESKNKITPEIVNLAKEQVIPELTPDVLKGLRKHELLAALAIARRLSNKGINATTINEAYYYYQIDCKRNATVPNAKSTFQRYVENLVQREIIIKDVHPSRRSGRGRYARIMLRKIPAILLIKWIGDTLLKIRNGEGENYPSVKSEKEG